MTNFDPNATPECEEVGEEADALVNKACTQSSSINPGKKLVFNMETAGGMVTLMKITGNGAVVFPHAKNVIFELVKIMDETASKMTEAHVVFKIEFINPIFMEKIASDNRT